MSIFIVLISNTDGYFAPKQAGELFRKRWGVCVQWTSMEKKPEFNNSNRKDIIILEQNIPNPFEDEAEISFVLPEECHVKLSISNALGQILSVLVDGNMTKGKHSTQKLH